MSTVTDAFKEVIEQAVEIGVLRALNVNEVTNRRLLSVDAAAVYLSLSKREIYNMIAAHELTAVKHGRSALPVRGTRVSLYDQPPFAPQATSLTGRAAFRNQRRQMIFTLPEDPFPLPTVTGSLGFDFSNGLSFSMISFAAFFESRFPR